MKSPDASGVWIIEMSHGTMPDVVSQAKISDFSSALVRVAPWSKSTSAIQESLNCVYTQGRLGAHGNIGNPCGRSKETVWAEHAVWSCGLTGRMIN